MKESDADAEEPGAERRRFTRVSFVELAKLRQGDHFWNVDVLDVSLKGVMLTKPVHWSFDAAQPCRLTLHLGCDEPVVEMQARAAYEGDHRLGLECTEIDVDSLACLRRIIAVNTGKPEYAQRELAELIAAGH